MQIDMIRDCKKKGFNSKITAEKLQIPIAIVNEYYGKLNSIELSEQAKKADKKTESVAKMRVGHFERLLEIKDEENSSLGETQRALALNIKALWKMIRMLESRKKMLEQHITQMELYIQQGSGVADIFIEAGIEPNENNV